MTTITGFDTYDVRFPTSLTLADSDAMNPAPDYSAAALIVRTDSASPTGHAHVFTIGRGNEIQLAAIRALEPFLAGRDLDELLADLGGLSRRLVSDSPLRWLGPERGIVHMAIGAVVNACWDLAARRAGQPLWLLLASLPPEQIVSLVDFTYLTDVLTPDDALEMLERAEPGRAARIRALQEQGYPAYTSSPGWLGYSDDQLAGLCAACRVAGVNENIANLLLAAKFGVPVCPHAGGVGLCEMVQHLSMFDYVAVSGSADGRRIEWIDHLHEHFTTPARVEAGRYRAPSAPGTSAEFRPESVKEFSFPDGAAWQGLLR